MANCTDIDYTDSMKVFKYCDSI